MDAAAPHICSVCNEPLERARRWRRLRFAMAMAQVTGVVISFALIVSRGVAPPTLAAVVLTSAATTVSVLLFGGRRSAR
jgi:hypothetical protein